MDKKAFYAMMNILVSEHSIMKKLGNKFIIWVILIISMIVFSQVYVAYSQNNKDTNSYVRLLKWNATLNETQLRIDSKNILSSWDKVRVIGNSSIAVIEWWDGSMTRLWGNTKISIEQNEISRDYTNINISFDLIAGKTWSNIVSFIGSDSSFTQTFNGIEAWVRWTIFDVDLEQKFIHVSDHSIQLTLPNGDPIIIPEWQVLSLETFSFIELSKYIAELEDAAWKEINSKLDNEYMSKLIWDLDASIKSTNPFLYIMRFISQKYAILYVLDTYESTQDINRYIATMSESEKKKVYDTVLSVYQEMNFVSPSDDVYSRKMNYKRALIALDSEGKNSQRLINAAWYDLQDILESGNTQWLEDTIEFLQNNIQKLDEENIFLLKGGLQYIPEELLEEFWNSFQQLGEILNIDISNLQNINPSKIGNALDTVDGAIQNFLDENVGWLLQQISN